MLRLPQICRIPQAASLQGGRNASGVLQEPPGHPVPVSSAFPLFHCSCCRRQGNGSPATGMPATLRDMPCVWEGFLWFPITFGSRELAEAVSDVICSRDSLLLANHGMVAAGKSLEQCWPLRRRLRRTRILPYFWETGEFPLMKNRQRRCFGQEELYDA